MAIEVEDAYQRMDIGTALASRTMRHAHANGPKFLTATALWENRAARGLLRNTDFVPGRTAAAKSSTNSNLE